MFGRKLDRQQAAMVGGLLDEALVPFVALRNGTVIRLSDGEVDVSTEGNKSLFTECIQKFYADGTIETNGLKCRELCKKLESDADSREGDERLSIHAGIACGAGLCKIEMAAKAACEFPKDKRLNQAVCAAVTAALGCLDELLGVKDKFNSESAPLLQAMPASNDVFERVMF